MKKQYQIDKQRAAQEFRNKAGASQQQIQFALPLPEVLKLVQQGLMQLACCIRPVKSTGLAWQQCLPSDRSMGRSKRNPLESRLAAAELEKIREHLPPGSGDSERCG